MPRGGKRKNSGRPAGARNKVTERMRALAERQAERALMNLARLMTDATSENVQFGSAREFLHMTMGKPRMADADPQSTVKVERTYRWAANEAEATFDPARPKPAVPPAPAPAPAQVATEPPPQPKPRSKTRPKPSNRKGATS